MSDKSITARAKEALNVARQLQIEGKNWLEAHNVVYGIGGKCAGLFPTQTERAQFAKTKEYQKMSEILDDLPETS